MGTVGFSTAIRFLSTRRVPANWFGKRICTSSLGEAVSCLALKRRRLSAIQSGPSCFPLIPEPFDPSQLFLELETVR